MKPTIVLAHGAFADSSSWNDVVAQVTRTGLSAVAYANPLRSIAGDAAGLTELVRSLDGPVVLVGHSYGGAVITNVPPDAANMIGLVYVAAFALDAAESPGDAAGSVPGSTLGDALQFVALPDGGADAYIDQQVFHGQFCADLPVHTAQLMAVAQRPIAAAALGEPSGPDPLWKHVPSWFIFGDRDLNIPVQALRNMADRANSKRTVEVAGASHVVGMSHPAETADLIIEAAGEVES